MPSDQLPSYVDDAIEGYLFENNFYEEEAHENVIKAEGGKIYIDLATNDCYRWGGSVYVKIADPGIRPMTDGEIDEILALWE